MAEGCMAHVVAKRDGFGEVFIEIKGARDGPGDLCNFKGMGQSSDVMVAEGGNEYLSLVLEATKGLAVKNPVTVPLVLGAN